VELRHGGQVVGERLTLAFLKRFDELLDGFRRNCETAPPRLAPERNPPRGLSIRLLCFISDATPLYTILRRAWMQEHDDRTNLTSLSYADRCRISFLHLCAGLNIHSTVVAVGISECAVLNSRDPVNPCRVAYLWSRRNREWQPHVGTAVRDCLVSRHGNDTDGCSKSAKFREVATDQVPVRANVRKFQKVARSSPPNSISSCLRCFRFWPRSPVGCRQERTVRDAPGGQPVL